MYTINDVLRGGGPQEVVSHIKNLRKNTLYTQYQINHINITLFSQYLYMFTLKYSKLCVLLSLYRITIYYIII